MQYLSNVRGFIIAKTTTLGISCAALENAIGLGEHALYNIIHARSSNPNLLTLVRTADYFCCTLDSIFGRSSENYTRYNNVLPLVENSNLIDDYLDNFRVFLRNRMQDNHLTISNMERVINLPKGLINKFLTPSTQRAITIHSTLLIADHFNCVLDEMLGRVIQDSVLYDTQAQRSKGHFYLISLKKFLEQRILNNQVLSVREIERRIGITRGSTSTIVKTDKTSVNIVTLYKIAVYLSCSIDEMLDRVSPMYRKYHASNVTEDVVGNLRSFIINRVQETGISVEMLEKILVLPPEVIRTFLSNVKKNLHLDYIVIIADYFHCSIDHILGK